MLGAYEYRGSCRERGARVADPEIEPLRWPAGDRCGCAEELPIHTLQSSKNDSMYQIVLLRVLNKPAEVV